MTEVKIFLDEDDSYNGKPMHEYIMRHLMHNNIIGASIFPAIMGFGKKHHLNTPKKFGNVDEVPYMLMFIDDDKKIEAVLPHIKEIVGEGLIITAKVNKV